MRLHDGRPAGRRPPAGPYALPVGEDEFQAGEILGACPMQSHAPLKDVADDAGVAGGAGEVEYAVGSGQPLRQQVLSDARFDDRVTAQGVDLADAVEAGEVQDGGAVADRKGRAQAPVAAGADGVQRDRGGSAAVGEASAARAAART